MLKRDIKTATKTTAAPNQENLKRAKINKTGAATPETIKGKQITEKKFEAAT